jgi:A/G-specific adenine glycosylase
VARREGRIDELPAARKRKPLPLKHSTWLVLLHKGSVLLERRPSVGIWGGLWVFPELVSGMPEAFCRNVLGCEVKQSQRLPDIEHGFTHFKLRVQPFRCTVQKFLPCAEAPGRIWLDVAEAARAAVPAPVRKLLLGLA